MLVQSTTPLATLNTHAHSKRAQLFYSAAVATVYTAGGPGLEALSLKTYTGSLEHTPEVGKQLTDRVMIVDCIVIVDMLVHIFSSKIFGLQVHHKQQQQKIICRYYKCTISQRCN